MKIRLECVELSDDELRLLVEELRSQRQHRRLPMRRTMGYGHGAVSAGLGPDVSAFGLAGLGGLAFVAGKVLGKPLEDFGKGFSNELNMEECGKRVAAFIKARTIATKAQPTVEIIKLED